MRRPEAIQPGEPGKKPAESSAVGAVFDTEAFSKEDELAMLSIVGKVLRGEYQRIFDTAQGAVKVVDPETQKIVLDTSADHYYALEARLRAGKL
jgi:hypothetical protein